MTEYYRKKCPYCEGEGNHYFEFCSTSYYKCSSCDLIYKNSNKSYREIVLKYRDDYYDNFGASEIDGERDRLYKELLKFIEQKVQTGKILDVGTGCGFFLQYARERGWNVKGIDPSPKSVNIAKNSNNLDVKLGTLEEFRSSEKFDIITFINALDHSAQPWHEVQLARTLLKPEGFIFIRSPNGFLHSHILRISSKFGFENRISSLLVFHEFSFTLKYIKRLLHDCGFSKVIVQNSPPSKGFSDEFSMITLPNLLFRRLIYFMSGVFRTLSLGHLLLSPSLWVVASQNKSPEMVFSR